MAKHPIYLEDLIDILQSHSSVELGGYSGSCARVVGHDKLLTEIKYLLRKAQKADAEAPNTK